MVACLGLVVVGCLWAIFLSINQIIIFGDQILRKPLVIYTNQESLKLFLSFANFTIVLGSLHFFFMKLFYLYLRLPPITKLF